MKKREKERLIRALEKQGARVTRTASGWIVRTDQGTMGTHRSDAHGNDADAIRRDVRRIGLSWPF